MYTRSALEHSRQFPSPPRSCSPQSPSALVAFSPLGVHFHSPVLRQIQHYALGNPTALLQSFVFRHLRTLSFFVYHLTLASLSVAHASRKTPGGWPPLVAGRRPPATLP